jgi:hypothetical protein
MYSSLRIKRLSLRDFLRLSRYKPMYSSLRIKRLRLKDFLSLSRYKDIFHFAIEMIEQTFELLLCQLPSECTITKSII